MYEHLSPSVLLEPGVARVVADHEAVRVTLGGGPSGSAALAGPASPAGKAAPAGPGSPAGHQPCQRPASPAVSAGFVGSAGAYDCNSSTTVILCAATAGRSSRAPEQSRAEQSWSGQGRAGQGRAEQCSAELGKAGPS